MTEQTTLKLLHKKLNILQLCLEHSVTTADKTALSNRYTDIQSDIAMITKSKQIVNKYSATMLLHKQ